MRVAVIGLGAAGAAACRFLAEAGHTVVGYERFFLHHAHGSSHGASRIIRLTYPDRLYTKMMGDAYPLWQALEQKSGEELLVRCGGLYFGPNSHPELAEIADALTVNHHFFERLTRTAVARRFPALRLRDNEHAIFQPDSGFLRAEDCVAATISLARRDGAVIRENTNVTHIEPDDKHVTVHTDNDRAVYDRVIVAAGPWADSLLPDLSLPLTVTRQQIVYLAPRDAPSFAPENFPVWIDADTYWYGFPDDGRIPGVKLARHVPGSLQNPDGERENDPAEIRDAVTYAAERLPGLRDHVTYQATCLYTNTPDSDFIVEAPPETPNLLLLSACSGHGFKFTPLLGKWAADWVEMNTLPADAGRFSRQRFRA